MHYWAEGDGGSGDGAASAGGGASPGGGGSKGQKRGAPTNSDKLFSSREYGKWQNPAVSKGSQKYPGAAHFTPPAPGSAVQSTAHHDVQGKGYEPWSGQAADDADWNDHDKGQGGCRLPAKGRDQIKGPADWGQAWKKGKWSEATIGWQKGWASDHGVGKNMWAAAADQDQWKHWGK